MCAIRPMGLFGSKIVGDCGGEIRSVPAQLENRVLSSLYRLPKSTSLKRLSRPISAPM
jgi:hypothetical protein